MGMHLAHNIRILKIKSKKKILRPDLAPSFAASGHGTLLTIFNILMLWVKCMPIDFEFQQGLFYILTNCQT